MQERTTTCQNNLLEYGGLGGYSDGHGRVAHPPCRYHAAHGCALGGADRRFTVGVANLSDQRASRLAKKNRNRQDPINNVPFPRSRTLWHPIGEMRRLYLGRLRGLEFGVPAGRPTMRMLAQKRFRRGAAVRTAPRQRADTPQVARPPTPAEHAQPHVGPPAEDPCRPVHHPPQTVDTKPTPDPASLPGGRGAMASEARMGVAAVGRLSRTAPDLRDLWTVQATRAGSGLRKGAGRYDALAMR